MRLLCGLLVAVLLSAQTGFFPVGEVRPGMQGMSGSPVYINGRLLGAVAMTFTYSKEPIAAIRPIADLIRAGEMGGARRPGTRASLSETNLMRGFEPAGTVLAGGSRLVDIGTPLSFSGFARGSHS